MNRPIAFIGTTGSISNSFAMRTADAFAITGHNTGNLAFQHASWRLIADEKRVFGFDFDPQVIRDTCDLIVLPAANFLYAGFDLGGLAKRLEETGLPLMVLGLGAQAMRSTAEVKLQPGTERLLRLMGERCETIAIRGKYTAEVLERYNVHNFEVLGCPSNFINNDLYLGAKIAARLKDRHHRVALCPTFYSYNSEFEEQLYRACHEGLMQIVCQDPLAAVAVARGDLDEAQKTWLATASGFLTRLPAEERDGLIARLRAYFSIDAWMEGYRAVDLVLGSRIHGVNLGWQAERAGLVVSFDLRTEELADTMGVPWIKAGDVKLERGIIELVRERTLAAVEDYDQRRGVLAGAFTSLFKRSGLTPSAELVKLMQAGSSPAEAAAKTGDEEPSWGFLEQYNRNRIAGWVDTKGNAEIQVTVALDGRDVGSVVASSLRPDLGPKARGFQVIPPEGAFTADVMKVEAFLTKTGKQLQNSPVVTSFRKGDQAKVLHGKNGYLFLQNDSNEVLRQISGERLLSEQELDLWKRFFVDINETLECNHSRLVFFVAPAKECVFAEHLPDGVAVSERRPVTQIEDLLRALRLPSIEFLYPLQRLREARDHDVYPKGDSHWTDYGAAIALDDMWSALWPDRPNKAPASGASFRREFRNADLLSKLGGVCVEAQPVTTRRFSRFERLASNGVVNTGRLQSFRSTLPDAGSSLLLVHDSYGDWIIPFLAESAASLRTQWGVEVSKAALNEMPQTILIERAERFLTMPSRLVG